MFGCISKEVILFNLSRVIVFCPMTPEHFIPFWYSEKIDLIHPQNNKDLICMILPFFPIMMPHIPFSTLFTIEPIQGSSQVQREDGTGSSRLNKCPMSTLQRTSRPSETQCMKRIPISFRKEQKWNKMSKYQTGFTYCVQNSLKSQPMNVLAIQIGIREYKAF